jgi:hypothetical protein
MKSIGEFIMERTNLLGENNTLTELKVFGATQKEDWQNSTEYVRISSIFT